MCRNRPRDRHPAISSLFFAKKVVIINAMEKSNLEIRVEHIEKVVDDIQRDVKAMDNSINTRMAGMDARMARMEVLMEGISGRVVNAEQKAEKTENRLWFIVIAVIVSGGIPALITKILS